MLEQENVTHMGHSNLSKAPRKVPGDILKIQAQQDKPNTQLGRLLMDWANTSREVLDTTLEEGSWR